MQEKEEKMKDINYNFGKGFTFKKHIPEEVSHFDRVFDVFKDLLTHTSGDIEEAFEWLEMLDKEYDIFTDEFNEYFDKNEVDKLNFNIKQVGRRIIEVNKDLDYI